MRPPIVQTITEATGTSTQAQASLSTKPHKQEGRSWSPGTPGAAWYWAWQDPAGADEWSSWGGLTALWTLGQHSSGVARVPSSA